MEKRPVQSKLSIYQFMYLYQFETNAFSDNQQINYLSIIDIFEAKI